MHPQWKDLYQEAVERMREVERRLQRLTDLVRHCRHALHQDSLISDEEFAQLAKDHPAVARLESYDGMRAQLRIQEQQLSRWKLCNTCGGAPLQGGKQCICGGTGSAADELTNLRLEVIKQTERADRAESKLHDFEKTRAAEKQELYEVAVSLARISNAGFSG